MKSAFIGHSYHKITSSSSWFIDLISKHSPLELFWDETWLPDNNEKKLDIDDILTFDRIFVWQIGHIAQSIAKVAPEKLVYIPMWDGVYRSKDASWEAFSKTRVISFAWMLHDRLRRLGISSFHCQYFPDPARYPQVTDFSTQRGYLWQRRKEIGWPQVTKLSGEMGWDAFQLHVGMDPGFGEIDAPSIFDIERNNIRITRFSSNATAAHTAASEANIYFAPRLVEGIGMSFLEAMARGQCVVAPDAATMSEYIEDGVTGLLYDPAKLRALDFSAAKNLGGAARRHIERGFEDWKFDLAHRLPEILFPDGSGLTPPRTRSQAEWRMKPSSAAPRRRSGKPKVTVSIATLNAADSFQGTFDSIWEQTFDAIEIVVADGGSTDGTVALIQNNRDRIAAFISEPDAGPYDAMNKCARLGNGNYIIYMNAGDCFASRESVARAFDGAPSDVDFIIGHHIYLDSDQSERFSRAFNFENTWRILRSGELTKEWLGGVPRPQATFTRREMLLSQGGYSQAFKLAADHEFMYRMRLDGAKFHHCGEILALYAGNGLSQQFERKRMREWWRIARLYGDQHKVDRFFRRSYKIGPWSPTLLLRIILSPISYGMLSAEQAIRGLNRQRKQLRRRHLQRRHKVASQ